jgi:hypothetical protein
MIDVIHLKATDATRSGSIWPSVGSVRLKGNDAEDLSGTLTFHEVWPSKLVRWMAAEVMGRFSHESVRIRFSDVTTTYYLDVTDLQFKAVTAVDWETEWTEASLLSNLDLWTAAKLTLIVHLVRTNYDRDPVVTGVRILMDLPTWEGSVHYAARSIITAVAAIEPRLIHTETVSADKTTWSIGEPYSELQYNITSLEEAVVDGVAVAGTLTAGKVVLDAAAPAGSEVELVMKFLPNSSVRRTEHVTVQDKVPAWWMQNIVQGGGLNGPTEKVMVGAYEVAARRVELRIIANGISERMNDALQMRAALQSAFSQGLDIDMPSCRQVTAVLDGLVEVVPKSPQNIPMASGLVQCAFMEYVSARAIRTIRTGAAPTYTPVYTSIETTLPDGVVAEADEPLVTPIC